MSVETARPGSDSLKDFRGPEPAKSDDEPISAPVADDDGTPAPADDVRVAGTDGTAKPAVAEQAPSAPTMSPGDQKRAQIAARFAPKRAAEGTDTDGDFRKPENVYGKLAGAEGDSEDAARPPPDPAAKPGAETRTETTPKTPASPGSSDSGAKPAEQPAPIVLVVNGRTITKTLAEVAALSELSPDEVTADPKRAIKYAQRELATQDNLEKAQRIRRDQPARQPGDVDTRSTSPAPNQERHEAGDDAPDQPAAPRDTSVEAAQKLIEDIQIGDPKEIAPKLAEYIANAAKGSAEQASRQSENTRVLNAEANANVSAVKEFLDAHPEAVGKASVSSAMGALLVEEYRTDLRTALISEGETEAEANRLLSTVTPADIKNAHLARRLKNDPHVRKIDKALMETVYDKVRADFGAPASDSAPQQHGINRQERKDALPHQPRRASVPPATPAAQPAPTTRKAAVAEMAARTGRKVSTLSR